MKGLFITFEGPEGSGKTTIIEKIAEHLRSLSLTLTLTREPGGVPIAERIREIILDNKNTDLDYRCEAILYAASRRQHLVQRVIPLLERGEIVISDRYLDSSLAYQGFARGIGIEEVYQLNRFATGDLMPDLTILFDLDPRVGLGRVHGTPGREVNRLDNESLAFHQQVREGFHRVAAMFPERIRIVEAARPVEEVYQQVLALIIELLEGRRC